MNLDSRLLGRVRTTRLALALTILMGLVAGILTVVQASYLSKVIDRVFLSDQSLAQVAGFLIILLIIIILRAGMVWGSEYISSFISRRVQLDLRQALLKKLFQLGPAYTAGERTGELTSVLVEGIEVLEGYYSQYLPQLVLGALVPLTILVFIFPLDILTGVVLLLTAPLIPVFMILIGHLAESLTRRQWLALSRMKAYFLDVLQGLTTLKIFGRSKPQVEIIARVSDQFRQTTMSVLQVTFLSALVLEMVATLSTAVVAVEIGLRLLYGRLQFEQALFILLLAPEFYLPLRLLGTRFHAGMSGVAAARRIFQVLDAQPRTADHQQQESRDAHDIDIKFIQDKADDGLGGEAPASDKFTTPKSIQFQDVSYRYPDQRPALKDVSFQLQIGQVVALVGSSGAGKSTIAHLLMRFIAPDQGHILVNGSELGPLDVAQWRQMVAWVPQMPYLFPGSVAENIRLGNPHASLDEVSEAACLARADEFIRRLPNGYQTQIGERGSRLSAGQAQRLAVARAFLKNAPVLILDEPTANLDVGTEAMLQQAMGCLWEGRLTLVIAHRLNTTRRADQILVLDRGQIVGCGTHAELLRTNTLYQQLISPRTVTDATRKTAGYDRVDHIRVSTQSGETHDPITPTSIRMVERGIESSIPSRIFPALKIEGGGQAWNQKGKAALKRLFSLVVPYRGQVLLSILVGFATVLSGVGLMAASAYIISAAALQPSIAELQVAIVGVRAFGITRGLFRYLERYLSHQVTFLILARLRVWFYRALEPLAPARLMRYRSGDLLARVQDDIDSLDSFYVRALAPPLVAILVAVTIALFLSRFDPLLAWVLLFFYIFAGLLHPWVMRRLSRIPGRALVTLRTEFNQLVVSGVQGMADLLAFGAETKWTAELQRLEARLDLAQRKMAGLGGYQSGMSLLLANLAMWVVLILSIPLVHRGAFSGVYLAVVTLIVLSSFEAMAPLPLAAQYLEGNFAAAQRLYEIVDAKPEIQDPAQSPEMQGEYLAAYARVPANPDICVRELRFRYPMDIPLGTAQEQVLDYALDGIDFELPAGQWLAVVGHSGAGKSTLVNLLLRFWEYQEGHIELGGTQLKGLNQEEARRLLAVVPQNAYLFNATIRDNLRVAHPAASQDDLDRVAKFAGIHAWIASLEQGYETWVGELGLRLSAGERQRLAIARALLRDAPILILDEATAHLDTITECEVLDAIKSFSQGRTLITFTHRLVGLEDMDDILVLQRGKIVERGRHQDLLRIDGYYRGMWDLQQQALAEQRND